MSTIIHNSVIAIYRIPDEKEERVILPTHYGTIRLPKGDASFLYDDEATLDNSLETRFAVQPPWILPRRDWPNEEFTNIPSTINSLDHAKQTFQNHISCDPTEPDDCHYQHLWQVHEFLRLSFKNQMAEVNSLNAMLKIILRGIQHVACTLHGTFTIQVDSSNNPIKVQGDEGYETGYRCAYPDPSRFHSQVMRYRLVAGLINFQGTCWTAFIWDRVDKTLFHFDAKQMGRKERARAVIVNWARFLTDVDLPFDFNYVVIPVTQQEEDWQSGYICLMFLQQTLRGLIGFDSFTLKVAIENEVLKSEKLLICDLDVIEHMPKFNLRFRDWCMTGIIRQDEPPLVNPQNLQHGIKFAMQTVQYMAINELAISGKVNGFGGDLTELGSHVGKLYGKPECQPNDALTYFGGMAFVEYSGLDCSPVNQRFYRVFKSSTTTNMINPWNRYDKPLPSFRKLKLPPRFRPKPRGTSLPPITQDVIKRGALSHLEGSLPLNKDSLEQKPQSSHAQIAMPRPATSSRSLRSIFEMPTIAWNYKIGRLSAQKTSTYMPSLAINQRISLIRQDITTITVDAVVNAANSQLGGGSGINGAIRDAAGPKLAEKCSKDYPDGCDTGDAVITEAYNLPSKHVIHAVGPITRRGETPDAEALRSCYRRCLQLADEKECKSIGLCCIGTGIYGYPPKEAAEIACEMVREYFDKRLEGNIKRVVFVTHSYKDKKIYEELIP